MAPILNLRTLSEAQLDDLRRFLKLRRIPYTLGPYHMQQPFLYVREKDYARARQAVEDEFESYALVEREKWQREWRETYKGSYWKWLTRRGAGRAAMAGLSAMWFFFG